MKHLRKSMFYVGNKYQQLDGKIIQIDGVLNIGKDYETVFNIINGVEIHRYNRRDYGRVCGTNFNKKDKRNLRMLTEEQIQEQIYNFNKYKR